MLALKHNIYGQHLRREQRKREQEPMPYDQAEEDLRHASPEEADRITGFADPRNTVGVTVPLIGYDGGEYGTRVERISPETAGERIDADRQTITHLREARAETRFWQGFNARVAGLSIGLNVIFIILMIIAGRGC